MDHLLLIAIDDYKHWTPLRAPVADAEALREVLCARYGFKEEGVITLYNREAGMEGIVRRLRELKKCLRPEDRLLLFYAGHGFSDPYDNVGYLIPQDAERSDEEKRGWLPNVSLRGHLRAMEARHILVISDACFSGDLLDEYRNLEPPVSGWDVKADQLKSRAILTSGSSEPVQDVEYGGHSPFAWHLVDTLKDWAEPWVDAQGLFEQLRRGVKGQRPLYGTLKGAGDRGGALILWSQQTIHPAQGEMAGGPVSDEVQHVDFEESDSFTDSQRDTGKEDDSDRRSLHPLVLFSIILFVTVSGVFTALFFMRDAKPFTRGYKPKYDLGVKYETPTGMRFMPLEIGDGSRIARTDKASLLITQIGLGGEVVSQSHWSGRLIDFRLHDHIQYSVDEIVDTLIQFPVGSILRFYFKQDSTAGVLYSSYGQINDGYLFQYELQLVPKPSKK